MENIKKYWNDNLSDKAKIIIVSFFTFFTFICATMTNSIVSAYTIKDGNNTFNYLYYFEYKVENTYSSPSTITTYHVYYNDELTIDSHYDKSKGIGFLVLKDKNGNYYIEDEKKVYAYQTQTKKGSDKIIFQSYQWKPFDIYLKHGDYNSKAYDLKSNDTKLIAKIKAIDENYIPQLSTLPTPTIKGEQVEGIIPALMKVITILLPLGLGALAIFLVIYLIRRLVALSL